LAITNLSRRPGWLGPELDRYDLLLKTSQLSEKYEGGSVMALWVALHDFEMSPPKVQRPSDDGSKIAEAHGYEHDDGRVA
jgi:hypothetical protein